MKIEIDWGKYAEKLQDLNRLLKGHAKSGFIDGNKEILWIEEPDEYLLKELKRRGVEYKEV